MRKFTAASMFCGAGGLDIGFHRTGFRTVWANDADADACRTYEMWSRVSVVRGDIGKVNADDIPNVDICLGGFPC